FLCDKDAFEAERNFVGGCLQSPLIVCGKKSLKEPAVAVLNEEGIGLRLREGEEEREAKKQCCDCGNARGRHPENGPAGELTVCEVRVLDTNYAGSFPLTDSGPKGPLSAINARALST